MIFALHVVGTLWLMLQVMDVQVKSSAENISQIKMIQ